MPRTPDKSVKKSQSSTGKDGEQKKRKPMTKLNYKPAEKKDKKGKVVKKKPRWLPRTMRALREIMALQKGTQLLIQEAPFHRLVRDVMDKHKHSLRFNTSALKAVQQAAEKYMIQLFQCAVVVQIHRRKRTLIRRDLSCVNFLIGDERTR